jgi:hypothetical protein
MSIYIQRTSLHKIIDTPSGEKMSTVGTHKNASWMLKNTKHGKICGQSIYVHRTRKCVLWIRMTAEQRWLHWQDWLHCVFTEVVGIFCIVFGIHHSIHNAPSAKDSVRYSDIIWNKSLKIPKEGRILDKSVSIMLM